MPAPIVPTTPAAAVSAPSSAPATAPAAAVDADGVSFEALLAAALGDPRAVDRGPIGRAPVSEDGLKVEDAPAGPAETADVPPQALAAAVAAAAPLQAATPVVGTSAPAGAPAIDVLPASTRPLVAPDEAAPAASPRIEVPGKGSVVDPAPQLPEAARIAVPEGDTALRQSADLPTTQPVMAEVSAQRDTPLQDSRPGTDAEGILVPMAAERPENGTRTSPQPVRLEVAAPVGSREFGTEVGSRLAWMATHNHQVAELRIDPPQLGPVEMRLSIANDQASLSIVSPHAAVRDAIQASLPRLQDMLQGLGISLGNVSVGAEGFGQNNFAHAGFGQDWGQAAEHRLFGSAYTLPGPAATAVLPLRAGLGVIDVYA